LVASKIKVLDDIFTTFISMKIKLTPVNLLCFFSLVFLIHEIHDWAHFITANAFCGCLGFRAFDRWATCDVCSTASPTGFAMAGLAGPLVNYLAMWTGWGLMQAENPPEKQSIGFCLVYAALPLPKIMAALAGGGDETASFRLLFQHPGGSNHYFVAAAGLLVVVLLCLPPLIRTFMIVTGWVQRAILLPAFFVLPALADHWLVGGQMNKLLNSGVMSRPILRGGTQLLVVVWLALLLVVYLLSRKSQETLLEYRELSV
jgi:hypothetical protein